MLSTPTRYERPWTRQRLRVPHDDGSLFASPPLPDALDLVRQNHAALQEHRPNLQGKTLPVLRQWTQDAVLESAREYTSTLIGGEVSAGAASYLIAAGHQPTLFHPGVWVKNFALHELAGRVGGTALNLIVDNDLLSSTRIRIPVGDRAHPARRSIPFDADRPPAPWEEARVLDERLFATFGERITEAMSAWNVEPLAADIWLDALRILRGSCHSEIAQGESPATKWDGSEALLRDCLSAARHRLERRWGLANLELPLSRLCELDPFLWFASHLLVQLPRFREIHNEVLFEYRRVNRIRSRTHPVSDLAADDGWLEAPFWVWRQGDRQRGRVFAKQVGRRTHLSNGTDVFAELPLHPDMDACCAVEVLRELPARGIRFRTRALTTTLFARLCLCDLFIHGIGGAKYDEMTDRIIARFFRLPPPDFLTLSATLHLPLAEPFNVTEQDERRLVALLRDLRHNADRHLSRGTDPQTDVLLDEKARLIAEQNAAVAGVGAVRSPQSASLGARCVRPQPPGRLTRRQANVERYQRFQELNRQLAERTLEQRRRIEQELQAVRRHLEANHVLQDREYSFCLYPAEALRPFLLRMSSQLTVNS